MTTQDPSSTRRARGRLVFVSFLVLFFAFAAVVIWLVTAPVRERQQRSPRPAQAPATPPAPATPSR